MTRTVVVFFKQTSGHKELRKQGKSLCKRQNRASHPGCSCLSEDHVQPAAAAKAQRGCQNRDIFTPGLHFKIKQFPTILLNAPYH